MEKGKVYDLEERTRLYALAVRVFVKSLPMSLGNREDAKQVVRSSGSIGANYIETNESLGKKDFLMRIRISRKEQNLRNRHKTYPRPLRLVLVSKVSTTTVAAMLKPARATPKT